MRFVAVVEKSQEFFFLQCGAIDCLLRISQGRGVLYHEDHWQGQRWAHHARSLVAGHGKHLARLGSCCHQHSFEISEKQIRKLSKIYIYLYNANGTYSETLLNGSRWLSVEFACPVLFTCLRSLLSICEPRLGLVPSRVWPWWQCRGSASFALEAKICTVRLYMRCNLMTGCPNNSVAN